jgi:hypothetical protein
MDAILTGDAGLNADGILIAAGILTAGAVATKLGSSMIVGAEASAARAVGTIGDKNQVG